MLLLSGLSLLTLTSPFNMKTYFYLIPVKTGVAVKTLSPAAKFYFTKHTWRQVHVCMHACTHIPFFNFHARGKQVPTVP